MKRTRSGVVRAYLRINQRRSIHMFELVKHLFMIDPDLVPWRGTLGPYTGIRCNWKAIRKQPDLMKDTDETLPRYYRDINMKYVDTLTMYSAIRGDILKKNVVKTAPNTFQWVIR